MTQKMTMPAAVIGIGGAGCNILNSVDGSFIRIALNSDEAALERTDADYKFIIPKNEQADETTLRGIRGALSGCGIAVVLAGLGGRSKEETVTEIINTIADAGSKSYIIAINPFTFEGERRIIAEKSFLKIRDLCSESRLLDNDDMIRTSGDMTLDSAMKKMNESIAESIISLRNGHACFADPMPMAWV